jgi:hypothetical protein
MATIGTLKFKDRWNMLGLYGLCSDYMNNQTEENALRFLHRADRYMKEYCEAKEAEV